MGLPLLCLLLGAAGADLVSEPTRRATDREGTLRELERRIDRTAAEARRLRGVYDVRVRPLVALLEEKGWGPRASDSPHVRRIAMALFREGRRSGIDPRLLASVVLVEDPWLDPAIESPLGAVGLMQVMPFHAGAWGCGGSDLTDIETNICHGTRILAHSMMRTSLDLDAALLRYNGCVGKASTHDCHRYPARVYAYARVDGAPPSLHRLQ